MARPLRIEFPGAVYHVTARGNAQQRIFVTDEDRRSFLEGALAGAVKRYGIVCHGYCLMDNHYHVIVETPSGNLSRAMRQVNGVYTQAFNWRHTRSGHILQGRYTAILVEKDSHLLEVARYVVLNPVRAGMVMSPGEWRWSSYGRMTAPKKQPVWFTRDWILSQFAEEKVAAQRRYRKFVQEGIGRESPWKDLVGETILGGEQFVRTMEGLLRRKETEKEIPRSQRLAHRPVLSDILRDRKTMTREQQEQAVYEAHVHSGYTMKEIADYLGIHYASVSRRIRRVESKMYDCKT